ncbi:MAG: hypothetical protein AB7S81_06535 [Bdellovibrionales bacterium]
MKKFSPFAAISSLERPPKKSVVNIAKKPHLLYSAACTAFTGGCMLATIGVMVPAAVLNVIGTPLSEVETPYRIAMGIGMTLGAGVHLMCRNSQFGKVAGVISELSVGLTTAMIGGANSLISPTPSSFACLVAGGVMLEVARRSFLTALKEPEFPTTSPKPTTQPPEPKQ